MKSLRAITISNAVSSARKAAVRLQGELKSFSGNDQILSPVSSEICSFWKLTVQKRYFTNGKTPWVTISQVYSEELFMKLCDETGECYIIPSAADLKIETIYKEITLDTLKQLSALYPKIDLKDFVDCLNIRVKEEIVPISSMLLCTGFFQNLASNRLPKFTLFNHNKINVYQNFGYNIGNDFYHEEKIILQNEWERNMLLAEKRNNFIKGTILVNVLSAYCRLNKQIPLTIISKPLSEIMEQKQKSIDLYFFIFTVVIFSIYLMIICF